MGVTIINYIRIGPEVGVAITNKKDLCRAKRAAGQAVEEAFELSRKFHQALREFCKAERILRRSYDDVCPIAMLFLGALNVILHPLLIFFLPWACIL